MWNLADFADSTPPNLTDLTQALSSLTTNEVPIEYHVEVLGCVMDLVMLETVIGSSNPRGELEATVRFAYQAAILQNSDAVVASTIVATLGTDKPHPQLNCMNSYCACSLLP